MALQPIPADRQPYLVRGIPSTVLYLTSAQAADRVDLIPQFHRIFLGEQTDSFRSVEE